MSSRFVINVSIRVAEMAQCFLQCVLPEKIGGFAEPQPNFVRSLLMNF